MPRPFPQAQTRHPLSLPDGSLHTGTVFLRAVIDHPNWQVGEYSYASSFDPPEDWAARLAPYLYPGAPERLSLGRFCQIADGACFVTASANHRRDGFSTFPFAIFDGGVAEGRASLPGPGPDTVIGNDVWIGRNACILPGARIGDGAIVGAGAVVGGTVPPYAIVAGNPGRVMRHRFPPEIVERLLALRWWTWPIARILREEPLLCGTDLADLLRLQGLEEAAP